MSVRNNPEFAMLSPAFPCNPRPFAARIDELVKAGGTPAIQSDAAKACLLILVQQAYGQCAMLDTMTEFSRLLPIMQAAEAEAEAMEQSAPLAKIGPGGQYVRHVYG